MRKRWVLLCALTALLWGTAAAGQTATGTLSTSGRQSSSSKKPKAKPSRNAPAQTAAARDPLEGFDDFVTKTLGEWRVPGTGITIVQDGKIILLKGYGFRDVEKRLTVTPKTLFAIGSITKSFTVATLATLVDEGKLDWDKPVREFLPKFQMYDPVANDHITPRDLVTHRSGLPRHDALWYNSELPRAELVARIRYLEPSKELRQLYQYNNLMFLTAGYLAGQVGGKSWEELVRERLWRPLEMAGSNFSVEESQKSDDFALPYNDVKHDEKEELKRIEFRNIDQIGPAGSINSSAADMGQYVLMYLTGGKHGDKQVVSENNIRQMTTPQMVVSGAGRYTELGDASYGMGLGISSYRGHRSVTHGGAIDGFTALLCMLPQDKLGAIVLTNLDSDRNRATAVLCYNIFDRLLGLDAVPWSQRFLDDQKKSDESEAEAKKKGFTMRKEGTHPSHDLKEYAGEYENAGYGRLYIGLEGDHLTVTYNRISSPLAHFHYDIFEAPPNPINPLGRIKTSFFTNSAGDIGSVSLPLEPAVHEIVFTRVAGREMYQRSFLEKFVGQYQLGPTTVSFTLRGEDTLILTIPGQTPRELVPQRGTLFELRGLTGYSVEFKMDATGLVVEAAFYQPNGTFVAKRKMN